MKRLGAYLAILLLILVGAFLFGTSSSTPSSSLSYVKVDKQPPGIIGTVAYTWGSPVPFENGKVWIFGRTTQTNHFCYLFDLDKREVVGELSGGGPVFFNASETKLFCATPSPTIPLKTKLSLMLSMITRGKIKIPTDRVEAFWILDAHSNKAHMVGEVAQPPGFGSHWFPSPGFRYGYTVPFRGGRERSFFLCDLEAETFKEIHSTGWLGGWWSDHEILIENDTADLVSYDVNTGKSSVLFTADQIVEAERRFGISSNKIVWEVRPSWNGTDYDIALLDGSGHANTKGTFMLKLDKASREIKLLYTNFDLGWLGVFDSTRTFYAYPGEASTRGRGGDGGLYVRDLVKDTTNTLVSPSSPARYVIPRFYRDKIIYETASQLWQINLDGTGRTRLFPPDTNR